MVDMKNDELAHLSQYDVPLPKGPGKARPEREYPETVRDKHSQYTHTVVVKIPVVDENGWLPAGELNRVMRAMSKQAHQTPNAWFRNQTDFMHYDVKMPHVIFDRSNGDFAVVFWPWPGSNVQPHKLTVKELLEFFPGIMDNPI